MSWGGQASAHPLLVTCGPFNPVDNESRSPEVVNFALHFVGKQPSVSVKAELERGKMWSESGRWGPKQCVGKSSQLNPKPKFLKGSDKRNTEVTL